MKKVIPAIIGGIVIGGGTLFGVSQIPSVNNALYKNVQSQQVTELENTNSKHEQTIANLNLQLDDCKYQIKIKDESIATHLATIDDLTAKNTQLLAIKEKLETVDIPALTEDNIRLNSENADLKAELDTYKELVGADVNYIDIINNLQSELDTTSTALTTANAELEQLRADKTALENRVTELETELAQVKEELKGYKDAENVDKLNVANFKGTWYLDGTFEDYYNIDETGLATHNANADSGRVMNLYNQMYLFMNTEGSTAVTLSDDGNSFTTADGKTYSIFYINTLETTTPNLGIISGTYSYDTQEVTLNMDNTLQFFDGTNTYYGAYVVTAQKKNVGGNITITNYITATINKDDTQEVVNFEYVNASDKMINSDTDICYIKTSPNMILAPTNASSYSKTDYYKVVIKTDKFYEFKANESKSFSISINARGSCSAYVYNDSLSATANRTYTFTSTEDVITNCFEFCISFASFSLSACFDGIVFSEDTSGNDRYTSSMVISIEKVGNPVDCLSRDLREMLEQNSKFYKDCEVVQDYTNGTYTNSDMTLALTDDIATITPTDSDSITATSYTITANTDGTDIYQTATITYITTELVDEVETEVTHTLVLNFKNNNLISSTLDTLDIELVKN